MQPLVEQPLINELNSLYEFLKQENIYVFGYGKIAKAFENWLSYSEYKIKGFIISDKKDDCNNLFTLNELDTENIKIVMCVSSKFYSEIMPEFIKHNIDLHQLFILSDHFKQNLLKKAAPLKPEEFEVSFGICKHCNLNCQMCAMYAPMNTEYFMPLEKFEKDLKKLSELTNGRVFRIALTGGEPLLHPQIKEFLKVSRKYFKCDVIQLLTNGVLLKTATDDLWETLKENDITLFVTHYPCNIDYEYIYKKIDEYKLKSVHTFGLADYKAPIKTSARFALDVSGNQRITDAIHCYQKNQCLHIFEGKVFVCSPCMNSNSLNNKFGTNFEISKTDFIDLHNAEGWNEIAEFTATFSDFCRYCKVLERQDGYKWEISKQLATEWIDF